MLTLPIVQLTLATRLLPQSTFQQFEVTALDVQGGG